SVCLCFCLPFTLPTSLPLSLPPNPLWQGPSVHVRPAVHVTCVRFPRFLPRSHMHCSRHSGIRNASLAISTAHMPVFRGSRKAILVLKTDHGNLVYIISSYWFYT
ncbi:hypothetical protein M5D96_007646, partial [Drosophila gunungcola]